MGWFAIACVLGFLLYHSWLLSRAASPSVLKYALLCAVVLLFISLALDICLLVSIPPSGWGGLSSGLYRQINALGDGMVARFIFGGALGFGLGYTIDRGLPDTGVLPPAAHTLSAYMSIGLALVILAGIAPHLDQWLSRLSGFKSSIVETQLTSISTVHKFVTTDARDSFTDEKVMDLLTSYDKLVKQDYTFIEQFVLPDLEWQKANEPRRTAAIQTDIDFYLERREQWKNLENAFENVISPLATCVSEAVKNGYSVENARALARPIADEIHQILFVGPAIFSATFGSCRKASGAVDYGAERDVELLASCGSVCPYL